MTEGTKKNEAGLWEVFHGGEMIARVRCEREALVIYCEARDRTLSQIDALRAEQFS